jgi:pimeloyl-ACP methyl ester carboxylesterase
MPADATPADQADAYALLLDNLAIRQVDVIGISAGATSALQFALRHPDRITHLVIMSGNLPGNPTATAPPGWARAFYTGAAMWALKTFAPAFLNRAVGVPGGFPTIPRKPEPYRK